MKGKCLLAVSLLTSPVAGDLIIPTITYVFFEKDGHPYHEPVHFTVNCFGHCTRSTSRSQQMAERQSPPSIVFHYSATCPDYGCAIYEPYHTNCDIDRCILVGETRGSSFEIPNVSIQPELNDCTQLPLKETYFPINGTMEFLGEYYYQTPEYAACRNQELNPLENSTVIVRFFSRCNSIAGNGCMNLIDGMGPVRESSPRLIVPLNRSEFPADTQEYIRYLDTCTPNSDPSCPGWILDGVPLKRMTDYRPVTHNTTLLRDDPCRTFLVKANQSLITPNVEADFPYQNRCVGFCNETLVQCHSRYVIPSGNDSRLLTYRLPLTSKETAITPARSFGVMHPATPSTVANADRHLSRVESLYCGILQTLGMAC